MTEKIVHFIETHLHLAALFCPWLTMEFVSNNFLFNKTVNVPISLLYLQPMLDLLNHNDPYDVWYEMILELVVVIIFIIISFIINLILYFNHEKTELNTKILSNIVVCFLDTISLILFFIAGRDAFTRLDTDNWHVAPFLLVLAVFIQSYNVFRIIY